MFDRVLTICISAFAIAALVLGTFKLLRPHGQLEMPGDFYDFGVVGSAKLPHEFTLTNSSTYPIEILYTLKSCGCTSVSVPSVIAPRQTVPLRCVLDTHGARGKISSFITIAFRERGKSGEQRREFGLQATVQPRVVIEPETIVFNPRLSETRRLRINSRVDPQVQILELETNHQALHTRVDPDHKGALLEFDAARWTDATGFVELHIHTSDPDEKDVRMIVSIVPPSATESTSN